MKRKLGRRGVSLIELLVAVLVLSVGILGMAAGTGFILRMVEISRLDTQRAIALQGAIERVKTVPLSDLRAGSATQGAFTTTWTIVDGGASFATVVFVLSGPGRSGSSSVNASIAPNAVDTLVYTRIR